MLGLVDTLGSAESVVWQFTPLPIMIRIMVPKNSAAGSLRISLGVLLAAIRARAARVYSPNPGPTVRVPGDVLARGDRWLADELPAFNTSESQLAARKRDVVPELRPASGVWRARWVPSVVVDWGRSSIFGVDAMVAWYLFDVADIFLRVLLFGAVRSRLGHRVVALGRHGSGGGGGERRAQVPQDFAQNDRAVLKYRRLRAL